MFAKTEQRLFSSDELSQLAADSFDHFVFLDVESADRLVIHRVDSMLASAQSPHQRIDLFHTPHLGLTLALDGIIQLAEKDEHIYHELLIHPACLSIPRVRSALILGGGDGCAAREVLRYAEVEFIDLVELDQTVLDLCRLHLQQIHLGALDNARVRVAIGEGESYLRNHPEKMYDLIVADLTEPYDSVGQKRKLSSNLFSRSFYDSLKHHMNPGGMLVAQTGGLTHLPNVDRHHRCMVERIRESFSSVTIACEYIHSFDQLWTFTIASDHPYDIAGLDPEPILLRKSVRGLKYYDGLTHRKAFQTVP